MNRYLSCYIMVIMYLLINFLVATFNVFIFNIFYIIFDAKKYKTYASLQEGALAFHKANAVYYGIIVSVICFIIYISILKYRHKSLKTYISISKNRISVIGLVFILAILLEYVLSYTINTEFIKRMFYSYPENVNLIFQSNILVVLVSVGIIGPIFEEILFRGLIYGELRLCHSKRNALIIQALIFGIWHFNSLSFINSMLVGLILGMLLEECSNICVPIVMHATMNITGIVFREYFKGILSTNIQYSLIASFFMVIVLILLLNNFKREKNNSIILQ